MIVLSRTWEDISESVYNAGANCGTGSGGFKAGNKCAKGGGGVRIQKVSKRVFNGEPVTVKKQLKKTDVGEIGEQIAISYLKQELGIPNARKGNAKINNYAIDVVGDHRAVEVKTGLVSNGKDAQKWRLTFDGNSGAKLDKKLYARASPEKKKKLNAIRQKAILERKAAAVKEIEKAVGGKVSTKTITLIYNPDKKTADLYEFDGFHQIIRWNSPEAKKAYRGTFKHG